MIYDAHNQASILQVITLITNINKSSNIVLFQFSDVMTGKVTNNKFNIWDEIQKLNLRGAFIRISIIYLPNDQRERNTQKTMQA